MDRPLFIESLAVLTITAMLFAGAVSRYFLQSRHVNHARRDNSTAVVDGNATDTEGDALHEAR